MRLGSEDDWFVIEVITTERHDHRLNPGKSAIVAKQWG
jgi:hypothetical protein